MQRNKFVLSEAQRVSYKYITDKDTNAVSTRLA